MLKIWLFFQCLFCWKVKPSLKIKTQKPDSIVAVAFGKIISNLFIAESIDCLQQKYGPLPVIAQYEVADLITQRNIPIFSIGNDSRGHMPTWDVVKEICQKMKKMGYRRPILVGQPFHIWRTIRHFKKQKVDVLIPAEIKKIPFDSYSSPHKQTSNIFFWLAWDMLTRIYCLVRGYI